MLNLELVILSLVAPSYLLHLRDGLVLLPNFVVFCFQVFL